MSQEFLRDALEQAGRFSAAVRSAARCHIARVLAKSDPADGQRVLEEGLALAASLPDQEKREILSTRGEHWPMCLNQAVWRMIDHGFTDAATEHLLDSPLDAGADASIDGVEGEFTVGELCSVVEPGLDRPLVDETGLRGRYVIAFESDDPGAFLRTVMDRLSLVL